jgi:Tol biopolymer transport system component/DNA-binding winged helix-turn-helix (wHTH) protein
MPDMSRGIYRFDRFTLDMQRRQLLRDGHPVALQPKPLDLLVALVESRGRPLSKDDLLESVWPGQVVEESNLSVHMSALRKALGEHRGERRFIVTEPGRGYRFVAEVETGPTVDSVDSQSAESPVEPTKRRSTKTAALVAAAVVASLAVGVGTFGLWSWGDSPALAFQHFTLSRVTTNGKVSGVALAADGKYAAYVLAESGGNSLWVQQVGTASTIRVLPAIDGQFWGLKFSPDGAYLYYNLFAGDKADVDLFRIPSLGGVAEKIPNISAPAFSLSPDGSRIAHTSSSAAAGRTYLLVADANGGDKRRVAERRQPFNFEIQGQVISWSPDGHILAAVVTNYADAVHYSSVVGVDVTTGVERPLSSRRWYDVESVEWLKDGSGLLIVASDTPSAPSHVWVLSYPSTAARRITDDLSKYGWLGVASDGYTLMTVQTNSAGGVWRGTRSHDVTDFQEVVSESGPLSPLAWLPGGKILFRSRADGSSNLWVMDSDGHSRRQLTTDAQVSERGLCSSADGVHVVFVSWRAGRQNLWRLSVDDGRLTQLTDGDGEAYPSCSPDGAWLVYQSGLGFGKPTLRRMALSGGASEPLVDTFSAKPAISNDGKRIAYFYMDDSKWRIGIIPAGGGHMLQSLDLPTSVAERVMRWSPDGESLYYVSTIGDVGNVWALPLNGKPPRRVTQFTSQLVEDFTVSPNGGQFAFARSTAIRDAVLLRNFNCPASPYWGFWHAVRGLPATPAQRQGCQPEPSEGE